MRKRIARILLASTLLLTTFTLDGSPQAAPSKISNVLLPSRSPQVTFRILIMTGAAYDPPGKEGLAALTAAMLAQGGTRTMSSDQILAALYPTSASVAAQVDKEMTVFFGTTHQETLDRYYGLLKDMLLDPGFRADDFKRIRDNTLNFLKTSLREGNDEELGKEYLYNIIYEGHPYAHYSRGKISSLEKLTLEDVREFYRRNYTQANLVIGLAGGYPEAFPEKVESDFARLPAGSRNAKLFGTPRLSSGMRIEIVKRETDATAISLGFPIEVIRGAKDWPALVVAASYLGQHRSSNGRLFQRLRDERGLNYGDYAYVESFPQGSAQLTPSPITYNSPKSKEILDEDKVIQAYKINVRPADVVVRPVEQIFQ